MDAPQENPPTPPRPRRRALRAALAAAAIVAALAGLGAWFLGTETALRLALAQTERASAGRLSIHGASGSLLSTIRAQRIAWDGPEARLEATDVALDWSPRALWSGRVAVRGLGVGRLRYEITSERPTATLPADLALPIEVEIDRAAVGRLDWKVGARSGTVTGIAFGYAGGEREHRLRDVALVLEHATVTGDATLAATHPFALSAGLAVAGDATLRDARADASVTGTLESIDARFEARIGDASANARAAIAPFADPPLRTLDVDARAVDLAAIDASLPVTRIDVRVAAAPSAGGMSGTMSATNAEPGPWDAKRVPLAGAQANFAHTASHLDLAELVATLPGGGRIAGRGRIALGGALADSTWSLDVKDLDLSKVHGRLVATRLSGRVSAEVAAERQVVSADVAQQDLALAFDATVAKTRIELARVHARAGEGRFTGRGAIDVAGTRPFEVAGTFERLDPSRFGQFPQGSLRGSIDAKGTLLPAWSAQGRVALADGSRLSGVALSGTANGSLAPGRVRDASVDVAIGGGRVTARGGAGAQGDRLAFSVDALRLADVAALAPARVPRPLDGTVRARGTLAIEPGGIGGDVDLHAERLSYDAFSAARLDVRADVAPAGAATAMENRSLRVRVAGSGVRAGPRTFAALRVDADGSLSGHRVTAAAEGEGLAATLRASGAARWVHAADNSRSLAWNGTVEALDNGGRWPFRLESPAALRYEEGRVSTGAFVIAIADGRVRVRDFALDDGRVTTHGAFEGVAAAGVMRLAGYKPPLSTDLVLGGEWSIAATPRLNGTLAIRRERGDVYVADAETADGSTFAFGLTALALNAKLVDDAIDARIEARSTRAGNAQARVQIGVAPGAAPARLSDEAPLDASLTAELPTLRTLQPWLGTTAVVDGRARLEASAQGRLGDPALHFDVAADRLSVAAPQYGLHLTDGRLRARDEGGRIVLSEFSIRGGEGRFTASGVVANLQRGREAGEARVAWKAENFRLLNRPDRRLVIDGEGAVGVEGRKLALRGSVKVVQGHFEYARTTAGQLSDDVVIVGAEVPRASVARGMTAPLALDLEVDLGNAFTFAGEGLDTGLRGRVRVTTTDDGRLVGRGAIRAVSGTYYAFGQRLAIDRGRVIFDGPLDNPALDIVALRRNQAVEAGVAVTGTVKVPVVTLVSNPPVPDSEKLAWLVLGRSADVQSGADGAALQAATAALLSRGGKPLTSEIAQTLGLDDISFGGASGAASGNGSGAFSNQVVVFGKRISDRLTIAYQGGLTAATNALRLEYALSRTLTVRAEAGAISSIGIYYRRTYD